MKTLNAKIIRIIYWCFVGGFILHASSTLYYGWLYTSIMPAIGSEVRVIPVAKFNDRIIEQSTTEAKYKIFGMTKTTASVKYNDFSSMNLNAWSVLAIDILQQLIWLWFSWLLLRVFKSLKEQSVFEGANITRLRIVAIIVGLSPILKLIKNLLFESILKNNVKLTDSYFAFYYDYSLFSGMFYMLVILLLVEIFRYGMTLKAENDLTI